MYNLIVPCAGESSRFPNMRPKWLLSHPNGNMMLIEGLKGLKLDNFDYIYIVVLKEHIDKYNCIDGINKSMQNLLSIYQKTIEYYIIILDDKTNSQPETVVRAIESFNISGAIYIKDSDSYFFDNNNYIGNAVCTYSLYDMEMSNPKNKSYIYTDDNDIITNIVEKKIIGSEFCVGGYIFSDAKDFVSYYKQLCMHKNLYVSHIIYSMIINGFKFKQIKVKDFKDWGTLETWNLYKSEYMTLFIDLDGTLVNNSAEYTSPFWGETKAITKNVQKIRQLYDSGKVQIIITTSRKSSHKKITEEQLKRENIPYHNIIFDILHTKRIIINDYAHTNIYPSCDSINIPRNSDILGDLL